MHCHLPTGPLCRDPVAWGILLLALALRLYLAIKSPLLHDEEHTYILFARQISLQPGQVHLPIRESQHAALPCYIARAGAMVMGSSNFGFRLGSLVLGMATIVLVYRAAMLWEGRATARWAAFLLAVNEYHMAASSMALELAPQIFFVALAVFAAMRFFADQRPAWLYLAAVASAAGWLERNPGWRRACSCW
jgi:4-amino-4-deoxy-L-arabinose transferase-like glycosyltransferase